MIFTGVGSRTLVGFPLEYGKVIEVAKHMAKKEWTLRSGGAEGADSAFEQGIDEYFGKEFRSYSLLKDIFLPWRGFNNHPSNLYLNSFPKEIVEKAMAMASKIHPAWLNCSYGSRCCHARNCMQVLGANLNDPSDLLICWTKDETSGGTATAIKLARQYGIRVINLAVEEFKGV